MLHVRGSSGGTYFVNGEKVTRRNLRTGEINANVVFPAWHPSGKYIVFSSNKIVQSFPATPGNHIEIYDLWSSLYIYHTENNQISSYGGGGSEDYMETFPLWSPEGKYLYYCRAVQPGEYYDYKKVRYDLVRRKFDEPSGKFGITEKVFNASGINKSVSFPAISPDGRYIVFVLHDHGSFSIWHKEADLYLMNLSDLKVSRMKINSDETESYHSWSSNSKWLVFSSKRGDGLTSRPYLAYIESPDSIGKPFVLPQKDPGIYGRMNKTFNRPEFVAGEIAAGPRNFYRASQETAVKAIWHED
jgi:Tol biopolymer transport system component